MKKELFIGSIFSLMTFINASSLSHEEINIMVEKIKEERPGIDVVTLEETPNPFAIYKKPEVKEVLAEVVEEQKIEESVYTLSGILNHAAFIDGKWYKVGDTLEQYTILSLHKDSVILKRGTERKTLSMPKKKKKFILYKGD